MWPFKKKKVAKNDLPIKFTSIICVPGPWTSWEEFIIALVGPNNAEYIAAANVMLDVKRSKHYKIEFCEQDDRMRESFKVAGMVTRVSDELLDEISKHQSVIYISGETGNVENALDFAMAGAALLKAGGTGIKIETSGKAFEKDIWLGECNSARPRLFELFVLDSIAQEDGTIFSCGMQNLGLKDTIVSGEDFQFAVDLIRIFGYYQIIDKPTIFNNQTFKKDTSSPLFRISDERNQPYKEDERFENPYGMWRLSRV